ncbi:GHMP family kinase ATP-binding protein [Heliorestis convoluta]|uniref:GHMP kinase N terminal domain protein n=1 Tax=Heliorestis convoluta TaxID=356322 RepID=A0A5Q2MWQ2_9FIRM|nr:GHMP kinase [Heliorestis convoluta]QGG46888.1 GHMP kinase N terminal domain protein [Heliorestis convoluta]
MKGRAYLPGTCGELAQGWIDKRYLHITCPIDCWVTAEISMEPGRGHIDGLKGRWKAEKALYEILSRWDLEGKYDLAIRFENPLPSGKGLASSTADLCALLYALARACKRKISQQEMIEVILTVEPSDGLFLPGIAIFDHRQGSQALTITENIPAIDILLYDNGGDVDTIAFNNHPQLFERNQMKEAKVQQAFALIIEGLEQGDRKKIGQGATISALANQTLLPKTNLEVIVEKAQAQGALGLSIAHSGTIVGLLIEKEEKAIKENVRAFMTEQSAYNYLGEYTLVGGGARYNLP